MKIHDDGFTPSHLLQWNACQSRADAGKYTQLEFRRHPWFTTRLQCRWTPSRSNTGIIWQRCPGGGWGFKCTETWRPRFVFFVQVSITIITKTSRTGQITWIRSLETGNYSHEFIVVMSNFLLPWWQVHRYQTKMHLLKLAILVPTPSSWLFLPQQTFQWGRAEDNRRKKESGWGLVRPLEALVIPTHIPCILHAQSSGGTKNRNLTLFKYRIWGIKARLILE